MGDDSTQHFNSTRRKLLPVWLPLLAIMIADLVVLFCQLADYWLFRRDLSGVQYEYLHELRDASIVVIACWVATLAVLHFFATRPWRQTVEFGYVFSIALLSALALLGHSLISRLIADSDIAFNILSALRTLGAVAYLVFTFLTLSRIIPARGWRRTLPLCLLFVARFLIVGRF